MNDRKDEMIKKLKDCGCENAVLLKLCTEHKDCPCEWIEVLTKYRRELVDQLDHKCKLIDCIDYLLYEIDKKSKKDETVVQGQ